MARTFAQQSEQLSFASPDFGFFAPKRFSRDEMNLAEFPLTVLSTRVDPTVKTIEFTDTVRNKNGDFTKRQWTITGADKFGLPTSSDDEVLLGLLKLTVEREFSAPRVEFSRYELLRALRWTTEGRSYQRLQRALDRLSGVRIKATNAFFDNEAKSHSTRNFGIIDEYEINDGRENPKPSYFVWSDVLFKSFQVGFIKKLDLDFYLDLKSAISKRLYRYLDKHFWYRKSLQMNLFVLAHEKIGISRNYRHASSLKQQLDPAIAELISAGFLSAGDYIGKGKETQIVLLSASGRTPVVQRVPHAEGVLKSSSAPFSTAAKSSPVQAKLPQTFGGRRTVSAQHAPQVTHQQQMQDDRLVRDRLISALEERGLKREQGQRLLAPHAGEGLERIARIVEYVDQLKAQQSHLLSRSPVGFLYRAVEKPYAFTLPGEQGRGVPQTRGSSFSSVGGAQARLDFREGEVATNGRRALESDARVEHTPNLRPPDDDVVSPAGAPLGVARDHSNDQASYLVARIAEVGRLRAEVEVTLLQRLTAEVETALQKLRGHLSPARFAEAVSRGVDEKLLKLFAFPGFDSWCELRGR